MPPLKGFPMRHALALLTTLTLAWPAAAEMAPRDGWSVTPTTKSYEQLIDDVKTAAKANKMGIVTQAGPTGAARNRGVTIPGNRVIGIFNNVYAVNILGLSTAAMIEAPIRMYVTENEDGSATLSYKLPSTVFAPYVEEAGPDLATMAGELDSIFATIRNQATK
mmetsp:Transcript_2924/g.5119  ORF Transcript_2924/g.5119 Transcript_2924/m.5119 type:complete len:164 (-) Transcript_2924:479-970(-)